MLPGGLQYLKGDKTHSSYLSLLWGSANDTTQGSVMTWITCLCEGEARDYIAAPGGVIFSTLASYVVQAGKAFLSFALEPPVKIKAISQDLPAFLQAIYPAGGQKTFEKLPKGDKELTFSASCKERAV